MKKLSALLAVWEGSPLVTLHKKPIMCIFDLPFVGLKISDEQMINLSVIWDAVMLMC